MFHLIIMQLISCLEMTEDRRPKTKDQRLKTEDRRQKKKKQGHQLTVPAPCALSPEPCALRHLPHAIFMQTVGRSKKRIVNLLLNKTRFK